MSESPDVVAKCKVVERIQKDYVSDYEMEGDGCGYSPTEDERAMIYDAIAGLLTDDEFVRAFNDWQAAIALAAPPDPAQRTDIDCCSRRPHQPWCRTLAAHPDQSDERINEAREGPVQTTGAPHRFDQSAERDAVAEERERCAKVCEAQQVGAGMLVNIASVHDGACLDCARAIRLPPTASDPKKGE